MSGAIVDGSEADLAAGSAATVQARAVVIGAVTSIGVQPLALFAWLAVLFVWTTVADGQWYRLTAEWHFSLRDLRELGTFSLAVMGVATPFVAVLGVPAFLALNHLGRVSCMNLILAGALAGAIPIAVAFPEGWQVAALAGLHGAFGALAFYWAWRRAGGIPRPRLTAS